MQIDPATAASVLVALIAAASAYMAQRSAAKATVINTKTTSEAEQAKAQADRQADALREAYERARKFDVETIQRQDAEIIELRQTVARLETSNRALNLRVWYLERGYKPPELSDEDEESEASDGEGLPAPEQDL